MINTRIDNLRSVLIKNPGFNYDCLNIDKLSDEELKSRYKRMKQEYRVLASGKGMLAMTMISENTTHGEEIGKRGQALIKMKIEIAKRAFRRVFKVIGE